MVSVHSESDTVIAFDPNDFQSPTELAGPLMDHFDSEVTPWSPGESFASSNSNEGLAIELEPSLLDWLYSDFDLLPGGR